MHFQMAEAGRGEEKGLRFTHLGHLSSILDIYPTKPRTTTINYKTSGAHLQRLLTRNNLHGKKPGVDPTQGQSTSQEPQLRVAARTPHLFADQLATGSNGW